MDTTIILAHILGTIFIIIGLSNFLNKKSIRTVVEGLVQNKSLLWVVGLTTLLIGTTVVAINNVWTSGLPLLITILGWLTLLKGATILFWPEFTISIYKKMSKDSIFVWGGLIVFILGLILFL